MRFTLRALLCILIACWGTTLDGAVEAPPRSVQLALASVLPSLDPLRAHCDAAGTTVRGANLELSVGLEALGRGKAHEDFAGGAVVGASGPRVTRTNQNVTEWCERGPRGIQQGWTIREKPLSRASGELRLDLATWGGLSPTISSNKRSVRFTSAATSTAIDYGGLIAYDATGADLDATFISGPHGLAIAVADQAAAYPIVVDPWFSLAKLTASDGAGGDDLGCCVAVSDDGSTIVVGARGDDTGRGAAYVYERGEGWTNATQVAKLTMPTRSINAAFGMSVAVSEDGSVIAVGALQAGSGGAIFVFEKSHDGDTAWDNGGVDLVAEITGSDTASGDQFGAVAMTPDGGIIVAGARYDNDAGSSSGSAYVFLKSNDGDSVWDGGSVDQAAKLSASDGAASDCLGWSVAVSRDGSTAVAAAIGCNSSSGALYVFEEGEGWANRTEAAILTASDGGSTDNLGRENNVSISTDGDTIAAGAWSAGIDAGAVYVFERGEAWGDATETVKLVASDSAMSDYLGWGMSMNAAGTRIVAGAYGDDDDGALSGSAYVFDKTHNGDSAWSAGSADQALKLTASDAAGSDEFGRSIALDSTGNLVVIGAENEGGRGAVYVIEQQTPAFVIGDISGNTTEAGGQATFTVRLDTAPDGDVVIDVASDTPAEGTVSPTSLTFTSTDWDSEQTVTVTGVDDAVHDLDQTYTVELTIDTDGTDDTTGYAAMDPDDVIVINVDDDPANLPPTAPVLVAPDDRGRDLAPGTVLFQWMPATDPDGDSLQYDLYVAEDPLFVDAPPAQKFGPASVPSRKPDGAAAALLAILCCLGLAPFRSRTKVAAMLVLLALVLPLAACGETRFVEVLGDPIEEPAEEPVDEPVEDPTVEPTPDPVPEPLPGMAATASNLKPKTTYYWKVVARDPKGGATSSEVWSFRTGDK